MSENERYWGLTAQQKTEIVLASLRAAGPILDLDRDRDLLRQALDDNLVGALLATKHFIPVVIRGGGGRII